MTPANGPVAWAAGAAPGGQPRVWVYNATNQPVTSFLAYESTFTGGVRVAVADLNADGAPEVVTAAGPGGGPRIRVFDGVTLAPVADFLAYESTFRGGVWVAAGMVDGLRMGIATGADAGGGPRVRTFDATGSGVLDFFAFHAAFAGGVRVALGKSATVPMVYTAGGDGMTPTVRGFSTVTGNRAFERAAGSERETTGAFVAAGDLDGDGADEVVTAAAFDGVNTELRQFDGATGAQANQTTTEGRANGVGVVNWAGQRAVAVMGDDALTAYSLGDDGDEPTALGATATSGWGGAGASLGGTPAGGTAISSFAPAVVATADAMWYTAMTEGPNRLRLREKVTQVSAGEMRWEFTFANESENPGYPATFYDRGVGVLDLAAANLDDITRLEAPAGWTALKGGPNTPLYFSIVRWQTDGDFIMPNESRTFAFYTPVRPVGWSSGVAADRYTPATSVVRAEGPGKMPANAEPPKVLITYADSTPVDKTKGLKVAKWQNAFKMTADGTGVEVDGPQAGTNLDFIDRDPDRFNVWVYDKVAWDATNPDGSPANSHISAIISTKNVAGFREYNDPATSVDLVRYTGAIRGPGWFWSDSQLLVSNEVDDKYAKEPHLGADEYPPGTDGLTKVGMCGGGAIGRTGSPFVVP